MHVRMTVPLLVWYAKVEKLGGAASFAQQGGQEPPQQICSEEGELNPTTPPLVNQSNDCKWRSFTSPAAQLLC
jgi:hypothetical protein